MNIIEFPGFGLKFQIDPIALHLPIPTGGIRWYALFILTGILVACFFGFREYKRLGGNVDHIYNMLLCCIPVSVICARIYYVIFSLDEFDGFWDMLKIWEGGIAIYGAVLGAAAVVIIYCKRHKLSILLHLDIAAIGFMLGQMIGRWGNFVNGEAYGRPTDLPWRMVVNKTVAHPTFLYESLWLLLGFLLIYLNRKKNYFEGKTACLYLIWYGFGRTFIELLRTDSLMIGSIRVSSVLSAVLAVFGAASFLVLKYRNIKKI